MIEELKEAGLLTPEWLALEDEDLREPRTGRRDRIGCRPARARLRVEEGAIQEGRPVMLLAIETSKWKYAGIVFPWTADAVPERGAVSQAAA